MAQPGYMILGRVVKAHGLRGEVKVALVAESWEPFRSLGRCWLGPPAAPLQPFRLERERGRGRAVVLKLGGVDTPEAAAGLVGHEVAIPRAEAPPLPEGTYYHSDVLGLQVWEGDQHLGCVREILETPAHDVYLIQGPTGEWMLPATRAHIRRIDLAGRRIELEPWADLVAQTSGGDEGAEEAV
ncbi:MAG: ribosome maturation factor RimM [Candidatus Methylomirabilota bacterium]